MLRLFRYILIFILASAGLASCIYDYPDPEVNDGKESVGDKTVLMLNISTVNVGPVSGAPVEKIRSVRVIIVNSGSNEQAAIIECNRIIDLPEMSAAGLRYSFYWPSVSGPKQIFVIANESSVDSDLSTKLGSFVENSDATALLSFIDEYSFNPVYEPEGGAIYLPYTYHNTNITAEKGVVNDVAAYLVPVATKFIFYFNNSRPNDVNVDGITMEYANKANYLFAKVGNSDISRNFDGTYYYWVEWLAKVSEASWGNTDFTPNESFNRDYGWISDYEMPDDEDAEVFVFADKGDVINVKAGTETIEDGKPTVTPFTRVAGPFYVPESKNLKAPGDETPLSEQMFYLTLGLEDTAPGSVAPEFVSVPIPNLGALFRDTYVIITVNMSRGDIEVFAEIADWNIKTAFGTLNEDNPPANNPFASPSKR